MEVNFHYAEAKKNVCDEHKNALQIELDSNVSGARVFTIKFAGSECRQSFSIEAFTSIEYNVI